MSGVNNNSIQDGGTSGKSAVNGKEYANMLGSDFSQGNPYGGGDWTGGSYAGSHHYYDDGYRKPSGGSSNSLGYLTGTDYGSGSSPWSSGLGGTGASNPADPRTVDDKWNEAMQSNPDATSSLYNGAAAAEANQQLLEASGLDAGPAQVGRVERIDTVDEENMLRQINDAALRQANLQVNNAVQQGTNELQRNMQDAQAQYQVARNQIDTDERRAMDNQALYAEARGDRGGIGQAQYNAIQNTAATNRMTVQSEQTKLATDTARQITDLRAQGEYEKANQLLSITQNYLSQLMNLYTWAKETNLSVDEFNIQVEEWEENYKLSLLGANIDIANATGVFANGTPTFNTWAKTQEMLAAAGQAMMAQGLTPTVEQIQAMGWTKEQMMDYYAKHFPNGPRDKTYAEVDEEGNYTGEYVNDRTGEVTKNKTGGGTIRTYNPALIGLPTIKFGRKW